MSKLLLSLFRHIFVPGCMKSVIIAVALGFLHTVVDSFAVSYTNGVTKNTVDGSERREHTI